MNGFHDHYSENGNGHTDFADGYEDGFSCQAFDDRNSKFRARVNHTMMAASNKSFNYKSYMKYM